MNRRRYWKNRIPFLLTNLVCMAALTVFLLVCGNSISAVLLILVVWAVVLLTGLFLTYWKRKRQMQKLLDIAGQLSERYLISEVMELPEQAEDQEDYQLLAAGICCPQSPDAPLGIRTFPGLNNPSRCVRCGHSKAPVR